MELRPRHDSGAAEAPPSEPAPAPTEEPLPEDPTLFWAGLPEPQREAPREAVRVPRISGAVAQRLGGGLTPARVDSLMHRVRRRLARGGIRIPRRGRL